MLCYIRVLGIHALGVKWVECDGDRSCLYSAKVKN